MGSLIKFECGFVNYGNVTVSIISLTSDTLQQQQKKLNWIALVSMKFNGLMR